MIVPSEQELEIVESFLSPDWRFHVRVDDLPMERRAMLVESPFFDVTAADGIVSFGLTEAGKAVWAARPNVKGLR